MNTLKLDLIYPSPVESSTINYHPNCFKIQKIRNKTDSQPTCKGSGPGFSPRISHNESISMDMPISSSPADKSSKDKLFDLSSAINIAKFKSRKNPNFFRYLETLIPRFRESRLQFRIPKPTLYDQEFKSSYQRNHDKYSKS